MHVAHDRPRISFSVTEAGATTGPGDTVNETDVADWFDLTESLLAYLRARYELAEVTSFSVTPNARALTVNAYPK